MRQKTKHYSVFMSILTTVFVIVFSLAFVTANAANRYKFSGQGIVSENNIGEKYIRVSFKQISKQAENLVSGGPVTIRVNQASVFKPNAAGSLLKLKQENIGIGMMVTVTGSVKSDYTLSASKVTIVQRKFKVRGKLVGLDKDQNRMTVEVSASNYRPTKYVGKTININFTDRLSVLHSGGEKDIDSVEPLNQRVIIDGNIVGDDTFEAVQMTDPL